jgi:hypothetical protein
VGRHERGLDGFDPQATIDGLGFATSHPNDHRSQFIWNALLAPNKHLLAGVVETSTRQEFSYSTQEPKTSPIGDLASSAAWLPGHDGSFHRPCDRALDDLPSAFRRDQALAAALGMIQPVVEQASRELNVPARVLRALSDDPALVEMIEKQLAGRAGTSDTAKAQWPDADDNQNLSSDADGEVSYSRELLAAFDKVAGWQPEGADGEAVLSDGHVRNPGFRRDRLREEIEAEKQGEPALQDRFRRVPHRVWEAKDNAVRQFLFEQYGGRCQICGYTFRKRDGTPYFEGLYLVSRRHARWIDRPGNVISLCATCCAKLQHGSVEADPDIVSQIEQWRTRQEGGSGSSLQLRLCGEDVELHFKEKHLLDLQEIVGSRS